MTERSGSMKKVFLFLITLLLISNICFATKIEFKNEKYQYKTFTGVNSEAFMTAPSHWNQYYPSNRGKVKFLMFLRAPDERAFAAILREEEWLPFNDISEMTPYQIYSMSVNDELSLKQNFAPDSVVEVDRDNGRWGGHNGVKYFALGDIKNTSFPPGTYVHHAIKFIHNHRIHTIKVFFDLQLLNCIDVNAIINGVILPSS